MMSGNDLEGSRRGLEVVRDNIRLILTINSDFFPSRKLTVSIRRTVFFAVRTKFFDAFLKVAVFAYYLRRVCLSVRLPASISAVPTGRFPWRSILGIFVKICREIPVWFKVGQKYRVLCLMSSVRRLTVAGDVKPPQRRSRSLNWYQLIHTVGEQDYAYPAQCYLRRATQKFGEFGRKKFITVTPSFYRLLRSTCSLCEVWPFGIHKRLWDGLSHRCLCF
jgi:hypothetical protein